MDIAQTSMSLSKFQIKQAVDISMIKKTMDLQEQQIGALINQMSKVVPAAGTKIDTRA